MSAARDTRVGAPDFPITAALVTLAALATWCSLGGAAGAAEWLVADRDRLAAGELWRLVTGPLVHATWGHLLRDVALVAIVGAAWEAPLGRRRFAGVVLATLILPAAAVVAAGWDGYLGLSGTSHGLLAAALALELGRCRRRDPLLLVAAAALAAKVVFELVTGAPVFVMALGDGVAQAPLAHAVGVAAGIAGGQIEARRYATDDREAHRAAAKADRRRKGGPPFEEVQRRQRREGTARAVADRRSSI